MANYVWKYIWNPTGYGPEKFILSTEGLEVGSFLKLPHTYFKAEGFTIERQIQPNNLPESPRFEFLTPDVDFELTDRDIILEKLAGFPVYKAVLLKSLKIANQVLRITCNFLGDAFDPKLFNQELHQQADVEHKSLKVQTLTSTEAITGKTITGSDIQALQKMQIGENERTGAKWDSQGIVFQNEYALEITREENFSIQNFILRTPQGYLKFSNKTKKWHVYNPHTRKETLLTYFSSPPMSSGIPVVLASDPAGLTFVDWLVLDPKTQSLKLKNLQVETIEITKEFNLKKGGSFTLGPIQITYTEEQKPIIHLGSDISIYGDQLIFKGLSLGIDSLETLQRIKQILPKLINFLQSQGIEIDGL